MARQLATMVIGGLLFVAGFHGDGAAQSHAPSPTSGADLLNRIQACLTGSEISISTSMRGTLSSIFEDGEGVAGSLEWSSRSDFIQLFPDDQRLAAYQLYVECLQGTALAAATVERQSNELEAGPLEYTPADAAARSGPSSLNELMGTWNGIADCGGSTFMLTFEASEFFGRGVAGRLQGGRTGASRAALMHESGNLSLPDNLTMTIENGLLYGRTGRVEERTLDFVLTEDGLLIGQGRDGTCTSISLAQN